MVQAGRPKPKHKGGKAKTPWAAIVLAWAWAGALILAPWTQTKASMEECLLLREQILQETCVADQLKQPQQTRRTGRPPGWKPGPWKTNITTTVFWIGEKPTKGNPTPNDKSSWDRDWTHNYGGYDCPAQRIGYRPAGFVPKQNPFYIALPYNDINTRGTKPEAKSVIPWFAKDFKRNGQSVVKGKWVAIAHRGRVAYAQWEDCGPFRTDHWQYVFGNERPGPNKNKNAGLDVSPAVRDYLGMKGMDQTAWRFVQEWEVPSGPWTKYGENNPFSPQFKGSQTKIKPLARNP
jgi:hypothetical protein